MKIREYFKEEDFILSLEGDFDETSSPGVEEKLEQVLSRNIKSICFDLSNVPYISSAGIRVLIIAYKKAAKSGKKVLMGGMSDRVREVLETVGILPLFAAGGRQER